MVLVGRHYAIIGVPDPNAPEEGYDQHAVVWYTYVAHHEVFLPDTPLIVTPPDVCFPHRD
jgi:hypothetical protein